MHTASWIMNNLYISLRGRDFFTCMSKYIENKLLSCKLWNKCTLAVPTSGSINGSPHSFPVASQASRKWALLSRSVERLWRSVCGMWTEPLISSFPVSLVGECGKKSLIFAENPLRSLRLIHFLRPNPTNPRFPEGPVLWLPFRRAKLEAVAMFWWSIAWAPGQIIQRSKQIPIHTCKHPFRIHPHPHP